MKTVKDLKEMIKDLPDDMPVYVEADHGQTMIQFAGAVVVPVEDTDYHAEIAWDESGNDMDFDFTNVCLISD